eukprot:155786_1
MLTLFSMIPYVVLFICSSNVHADVHARQIISAHGIVNSDKTEAFEWPFDVDVHFYVVAGTVGGLLYQDVAFKLQESIEKGQHVEYREKIRKGDLMQPHYAVWGYEWPSTTGIITILANDHEVAKDKPRALDLRLTGRFPEFPDIKDRTTILKKMVSLRDIASSFQKFVKKHAYKKATIHWLACREAFNFKESAISVSTVPFRDVLVKPLLPWEATQRERRLKWIELGERDMFLKRVEDYEASVANLKVQYSEYHDKMKDAVDTDKLVDAESEKLELDKSLDAIINQMKKLKEEKVSSLDAPFANLASFKRHHQSAKAMLEIALNRLRCKLFLSNLHLAKARDAPFDPSVFKFIYNTQYGDLEADLKDKGFMLMYSGREEQLKREFKGTMTGDCKRQSFTYKTFGFEDIDEPDVFVYRGDPDDPFYVSSSAEEDEARVGVNNQLLINKYLDLVEQIDLLSHEKDRDYRRAQRLSHAKKRRKRHQYN